MARGSIEQRSPGSWFIRVDIGKDPLTGKRRQKAETVRGTKKQAEKRLTEILRELDQGIPVDASKSTLADYLINWLETVVSIRNRPRTIDR